VKYQFGLFDDTKIHGVPASGARFDDLAVMRGSYSLKRLRAIPARPVFSSVDGDAILPSTPRATPSPGLAPRSTFAAPEHDCSRRAWQELPAGPLSGPGFHDVADPRVEATTMTLLRADLHVHTSHSKHNADIPFCGEPRLLLAAPSCGTGSRRRVEWTLVAITDHDTIDGALELLDRQPGARDVIVGEEVSCRFSRMWMFRCTSACTGSPRRCNRDVQPLRDNVFQATAFPAGGRRLFCLNHLFHFLSSPDAS